MVCWDRRASARCLLNWQLCHLPIACPEHCFHSLCHINFSVSGKSAAWTRGEDQTLLELAGAQGVRVDSGCRSGICGMCEVGLAGECLRPSCRRVAGRLLRGRRADVSGSHARTGGKCAPHYSRLDDLTPVVFVTTDGVQATYSAGKTASTPFFFTKTTTNFAGFVMLALRPTVCTSSGPS